MTQDQIATAKEIVKNYTLLDPKIANTRQHQEILEGQALMLLQQIVETAEIAV